MEGSDDGLLERYIDTEENHNFRVEILGGTSLVQSRNITTARSCSLRHVFITVAVES
jgi:hypothetical protein